MHWVYLSLAILGEVFGTTMMKVLVDQGQEEAGILLAISMIALSYGFLSQATDKIPVAIANAFWEGSGMVLIAAGAVFIIGESISWLQWLALLSAIVGIAVTHLGYHLQEKAA